MSSSRAALPVPDRLAGRPLFAGFPVPYVALVGADGAPDFKVTDAAAWERVTRERRCGLCGEPLDYWLWFIGGPRSMSSRMFMDPAMHEQCARYAFEVCPYLATPARGHAAHQKAHEHVQLRTEVHAQPGRPKRMALARTRGYALVAQADSVLIRADPWKGVEWRE